MWKEVFVITFLILLSSSHPSTKSIKKILSVVNKIKNQMDAGIGGIGPVLPPWPCIQQDLDCVKKDGTNILNVTTVYPYIPPFFQDMKCNDFCRKTEGCEFWTIALNPATIIPPIINCFALSSCAEIEAYGVRSGPKECICPEYKGGCPFCPWDRPHCFGHCSITEEKCIGKCVPVSTSNDEVCTDLQAEAQYGDCANECHEESDDCKHCVADKTSSFNCGGKYAKCGIIDFSECVFAVGKAYLECTTAGSGIDILMCIAEKVASNSACRNCFCKGVCKFLPSEFCNLCQFNEDFSFKTALPPIRIFAEPDLTFDVTITRIVYEDEINCPAVIEKIEISPNQCAPPITRGECLIKSIEAVNSETLTPCTEFSSEDGSKESRFVIELEGVSGCKVAQKTNTC